MPSRLYVRLCCAFLVLFYCTCVDDFTVECRATDKVSVVEVEFTVEITSYKILRDFTRFHVESHVVHVHFTISRQLHIISRHFTLTVLLRLVSL